MNIMRDCLLERLQIIMAVGCVLVLYACSAVQRTPDQLIKEIDSILLHQTETGSFSGTVLVAKEGKIVLEKGYGYADRVLRIPNVPATQFQIASISKLMTRVSVLLENERGALNTVQSLSDFLPEYPEGDRIKLANLINHTSGIPDLYAEPQYYRASAFMDPVSPEELINLFEERSIAFEPGTRMQYSSSGYVLLANIIEKSSGTPFEEYLMNHVFIPLGMTGSGHLGFHKPDKPAIGYELLNDELTSSGEMDPSWFRGSGGVFASVLDLYQFYQNLYEEDFLSERSMQIYGVGRHFGSIWGFRSSFEPLPSRGIVVIVLSNFLHAPVEEITAEIMNILLEGDISQKPLEETEEYIGCYKAPDFDKIEREVRVVQQTGDLRLSIMHSSGEVLEMTLHLWTKDRFLAKINGRFAGVLVEFNRDESDRVHGVTLDLYGWNIRAQRQNE